MVANRGEIAVRIFRSAADLGLRTVAVYSEDDVACLHTRRASAAAPLAGAGPRAYLDAEQIVRVALEQGATMIHPGYGFLSESAQFARRVEEAGLVFVGPDADTLEALGDKTRARELAERLAVPVLAGTTGATSLEQGRDLMRSLGPDAAVMVKAVAGGGGRGMRPVFEADHLAEAFERCRSEAEAAFGCADVYVERLVRRARHIEVQIVGDGTGSVASLGERECSLQRRRQKLIEIAPAPGLAGEVRERITGAAVRMAEEVRYRGVGTFEFLVDVEPSGPGPSVAFLEANARLQVEHTVTEEVTGTDIVAMQLRIAEGATLEQLGLAHTGDTATGVPVRGSAVQVRVNMERIGADGSVRPSGGTLTAFEPPLGRGVRVDAYGYAGYTTAASFDSLLAKLVVFEDTGDLTVVLDKAYRALCELRIEGVPTNVGFLQALLTHPSVRAGHWYTHFVEDHAAELTDGDQEHPRRYFESTLEDPTENETEDENDAGGARRRVGATIDTSDPLAVLAHGKTEAPDARATTGRPTTSTPPGGKTGPDAPPGHTAVAAPMQGTIVQVSVGDGEAVEKGRQLLVMESMKMEHVVQAPVSGYVRDIDVAATDTVFEERVLLLIEEADVHGSEATEDEDIDVDRIRPDLAESIERHGFGLDANRPDAVERRAKTGQRTARENVEDLCDPGSFAEYGALAIAAQRRRRDLDDLVRKTPGDGMVCGIGRVNGELFPDDRAQCVVMSYDYTVLAGTQGLQNHRKKDRMFDIAANQRLPVVLLSEGGGGRPGDTDSPVIAGLDCHAFRYFGELSGLVPLVGINSRYCFAGNAALLGCCDVVIATKDSSIGMGGPAMIEGGGLGAFHPAEVGPIDVQTANGVVDIVTDDEAEAVVAAKRYLAYFQGALTEWDAADQRLLRSAIPENRLRIYDVRRVIETLADTGSVLELRRGFGAGMVTALARVEGRPLGIVANNPAHLAGAIDPDGADKAARFMQLCDAFDLPILFLCDTPGIMVGPEVETRANVRHAARMFVVGASLSVPVFTIVLRKGYGLGAQAMAGGSFHAPTFTVAWPTGEFGGMGLEGAVKLGFRNELAAIEDPAERKQAFDQMVAHMYDVGKAVSMATAFEIDDVIDPKDSRHWILTALRSAPAPLPRSGKKRPCIDTW